MIPRIYIAGKIHNTPAIIQLYKQNPHVYFSATWPFLIGTIPETSEHARNFWRRDLEEVMSSTHLIVLPDESLRGALVEVGAALAWGRSVHLVGDCSAYGTWQYHPKVLKFPTVLEALQACFDLPTQFKIPLSLSLNDEILF